MSLEHKLKKNKNIISLILVSFFSLLIFFSYETEYSKKAESYLVDLVGIFYYPQKWYKNILSVKEENIILSQKLVQFSLLLVLRAKYVLSINYCCFTLLKSMPILGHWCLTTQVLHWGFLAEQTFRP